jgi:xylulokinase
MYLGIDLGTSSVKLVLLDEEQNIIAQDSQPLIVSNPQPLWSEQDPHDWWQATCAAAQTLKKKYFKQFSAIKAIGLSGQQHGATLLNANGDVLRPAILWNDGRSQAQCLQLEKQIPDYANIIGSRIMPGFTAPKVLWVKQYEPEIFKQIKKVLLPKDYLRLQLTGEYASDMSDASGTGWLDIAKREWSISALNAVELNINNMPKLFEGSQVTGTVTKKIAKAWGISSDTVVIGGGGDNPASAISVNVIKSGSAFLSLGTSGVYFVAADQYKANPQGGVHTFCHCLPKLWHHMAVHLSAASCVTWLAGVLDVSAGELLNELECRGERRSPAEKYTGKTRATAGRPYNSNIIFLPYLSGERTPHNDPYAKGVFFGLTHNTTRADLLQAVLEGVAFAFADGQDAMLQAGIEINEVSVVGGGARSFYWGAILASALNRPLIYRADREVGGALGAARLAWLGINKADPQTAFAARPIEKIIEPNKELVEIYSAKKKNFKNLYKSLTDIFKLI